MARLIDTSIFIAQERGTFQLPREMEDRQITEVYISVVTASELLHGVHRAIYPAIKQRRLHSVEQVLAEFPILPIDITIARQHAALAAKIRGAGTIIGDNDLWIAATCLAHNLIMVTGNEREFRRIPGLAVENWLKA